MTEPTQSYSHERKSKREGLPSTCNNTKTLQHDLCHPILMTLPGGEHCSHSTERTIRLREVGSTKPQSRCNLSFHSY